MRHLALLHRTNGVNNLLAEWLRCHQPAVAHVLAQTSTGLRDTGVLAAGRTVMGCCFDLRIPVLQPRGAKA
jgi:hypothetical protein